MNGIGKQHGGSGWQFETRDAFLRFAKSCWQVLQENVQGSQEALVDMAGFLAVWNQAMQPGRFASHGKKYSRLGTFTHTVGNNPVSFAEATRLGSPELIMIGVQI